MKLGHPGEIIFTEETLETNSHQCNNPGAGARGQALARVPSSAGSCSVRPSHSQKGTPQTAKSTHSPHSKMNGHYLRQRTEMN